MIASEPSNLGFLTVLHEVNGYVGGYLVTNLWGRPLEFRLSTAVQANRVQQILYGSTLEPYICAEVIGKALVDKTATPVQVILTDRQPVLELRRTIGTPVVWLAQARQEPVTMSENNNTVAPGLRRLGQQDSADAGFVFHPSFSEDEHSAQTILDSVRGRLDLVEPFARIRDAIAEARKMGVTARS